MTQFPVLWEKIYIYQPKWPVFFVVVELRHPREEGSCLCPEFGPDFD